MSRVYIGIGSNIGNREENCRKAIEILPERGVHVEKCSSMIETEPWGVTDQPNFINMVIKTETSLEPEQLLKVLKEIEDEIGRVPGRRWGPRAIDLDILLYSDIVMKTADLEIPHRHMHERDFVLEPLAEIAPDIVHPLLKKSMAELKHDLGLVQE